MLGAISFGAAALLLYWVFLVRNHEAAYDPAHLDQAPICNAGRLLNLRDRPTFAYYGFSDSLPRTLSAEPDFSTSSTNHISGRIPLTTRQPSTATPTSSLPLSGQEMESGMTMDVGQPTARTGRTGREGSYAELTGWAVDDSHLPPTGAVGGSVDNGFVFPGMYGLDQPYVAARDGDRAYLKTRFMVTLSTNGLSIEPRPVMVTYGGRYYRFPHAFACNVVA